MPGADSIVLNFGAAPLRIAPASGKTYRILARGAAACARLVHEALRCVQAELLPRTGGLLANLSVLENVLLPAVFHGRVAGAETANLVYREFEVCGLDRAQADELCERSVAQLGAFERRRVALVRSLLMRPAILITERVFEGLTTADMQRVAAFAGYYRRAVPGGTLVSFEVADMPCPDLAADVRIEVE